MSLLETVRAARPRRGTLALWYIGGAGYLAKTADATFIVDPFVGPSNPPHWIRAIPPAFDAEEVATLGRLDAVLLTHAHGDHADPAALGPIARRTEAIVVGPESCLATARDAGWPDQRCRLLEHETSIDMGDVRLTAVPMFDPGAPDCNGYLIESRGLTVLHCGDGLYSPLFAELGRRWSVDAVCISVGTNPPGRTFYMDEADAARAARDLGAALLILQHCDLWRGFWLDPRRVAACARWYSPETRVVSARLGRRLTISRPLE